MWAYCPQAYAVGSNNSSRFDLDWPVTLNLDTPPRPHFEALLVFLPPNSSLQPRAPNFPCMTLHIARYATDTNGLTWTSSVLHTLLHLFFEMVTTVLLYFSFSLSRACSTCSLIIALFRNSNPLLAFTPPPFSPTSNLPYLFSTLLNMSPPFIPLLLHYSVSLHLPHHTPCQCCFSFSDRLSNPTTKGIFPSVV